VWINGITTLEPSPFNTPRSITIGEHRGTRHGNQLSSTRVLIK